MAVFHVWCPVGFQVSVDWLVSQQTQKQKQSPISSKVATDDVCATFSSRFWVTLHEAAIFMPPRPDFDPQLFTTAVVFLRRLNVGTLSLVYFKFYSNWETNPCCSTAPISALHFFGQFMIDMPGVSVITAGRYACCIQTDRQTDTNTYIYIYIYKTREFHKGRQTYRIILLWYT